MPGRCACTVQFTEKSLQKRLTKGGAAGIIIHVAGHEPNMWGISSAGRALAWHARGQRFDPAILHQKSTVLRRKYGAFPFCSGKKIRGCTARHADGPVTPPISTTADISPCRFNRGFCRGLRRQHGAGPTVPAPAWQALAGARRARPVIQPESRNVLILQMWNCNRCVKLVQ